MTRDFPLSTGGWMNFADSKGNSMLMSGYSQSSIALNERWTANVGLNAQYFLLNRHWTIEPRAGVKWQTAAAHSLALAYGMHSRHEKLDYYFVKDNSKLENTVSNKNLDFAKAHHIVLAYDWHISDNLHFKTEPYFQYLYDVPVGEGTPYSIINHKDWYLDKILVNAGEGRNYGIDFTLERYLASGYYYMLTASVFDSKYKGGDGEWRDTRYNRQFLLNALGGKEWMLGRAKQNVLGINLRMSYMGGDRYTPADVAATQAAQKPVEDERSAMTAQMSPAFVAHFTLSYKINKQRTAHEIALKMLNITGYQELTGFAYNYRTNEVLLDRSSVSIPNLCYKVEF